MFIFIQQSQKIYCNFPNKFYRILNMVMLRKTNSLTLIFLPFLLKAIFGYCQGYWNGQFVQCTFQYGYTDTNCTIYRFDACVWTQCVSYVRIGNVTTCAKYQTFSNSDWTSCSNRCCSEIFPYAYSSFQQCEDKKKGIFILAMTIIGSIVGGILLIVIIYCLIDKYKENIQACFTSIGNCWKGTAEVICFILTCGCFRKLMTKNQIYPDRKNEEDQIKWMQIKTYQQRPNDTCCICLEPNPAFKLECGHIYHRSCIIACIDKKKQCPLCRSADIDKAKAFCEKCSLKYYETNLNDHRQSLRKNQQVCQNCRQNNL